MAENDPFCGLVDQPESPFDVSQLTGESGMSLLPALGMMMPGYFLAAPREHITSFAQWDSERLAQADSELARHEDYLGKRFGAYFRVEHGSDNLEACGSGGCIDHAHVHLIPDEEGKISEHVQQALPWQQLEGYGELAKFRGAPYIYLGRLGLHYVLPDPALPGQWIRRQIAAVKGHEIWDYALDRGDINLLETFVRLCWFPSGSRIIANPNGIISFEWKDRHYPDFTGEAKPVKNFSTPDQRTIGWVRGDHKSSFEAAIAAGAFKDGTLFGRR